MLAGAVSVLAGGALMKFMDYVHFLVRRYLNAKYYDVGECVSLCLDKLLSNKKADFRKYMELNEIPAGEDLKMMKATVYYGKLYFLRRENKHMSYKERKIWHQNRGHDYDGKCSFRETNSLPAGRGRAAAKPGRECGPAQPASQSGGGGGSGSEIR